MTATLLSRHGHAGQDNAIGIACNVGVPVYLKKAHEVLFAAAVLADLYDDLEQQDILHSSTPL